MNLFYGIATFALLGALLLLLADIVYVNEGRERAQSHR